MYDLYEYLIECIEMGAPIPRCFLSLAEDNATHGINNADFYFLASQINNFERYDSFLKKDRSNIGVDMIMDNFTSSDLEPIIEYCEKFYPSDLVQKVMSQCQVGFLDAMNLAKFQEKLVLDD